MKGKGSLKNDEKGACGLKALQEKVHSVKGRADKGMVLAGGMR